MKIGSGVKWRAYFQNQTNPLLVLLRKQVSLTEFIHMSMRKQNLDLNKMYLCELSGSKFHSITSSNVILYNDVTNSIFTKSGFIRFWKWALRLWNIFTFTYACLTVLGTGTIPRLSMGRSLSSCWTDIIRLSLWLAPPTRHICWGVTRERSEVCWRWTKYNANIIPDLDTPLWPRVVYRKSSKLGIKPNTWIILIGQKNYNQTFSINNFQNYESI